MQKILTLVINVLLKRAFLYVRDKIIRIKKIERMTRNDNAKDRANSIADLLD